MKTALAALVGSLLGGFLAVILGVASAIREANDRTAEATLLANSALAAAEKQAGELGKARADLKAARGGDPKAAA